MINGQKCTDNVGIAHRRTIDRCLTLRSSKHIVMITLNYSVTIRNTPAIVWQKLWNDDTYRKWTAVFMDGSYAESSWKEGDKISFLTPGGNGMFGIIENKVVNEQMTFRHLGEIKNGIEINKNWGNATESYFLNKAVEGTLFKGCFDYG